MKHTDFYSRYKAIEREELSELANALAKHGGKYRFGQEDDPNGKPIVLASHTLSDITEDYVITELTLSEDGTVRVYGYPRESGYIVCPDRIHYLDFGSYSGLIDALPEPPKLADIPAPETLTA